MAEEVTNARWKTFSLTKAKNGARIGFLVNTDEYDDRFTGVMDEGVIGTVDENGNSYNYYTVKIQTLVVKFKADGTVINDTDALGLAQSSGVTFSDSNKLRLYEPTVTETRGVNASYISRAKGEASEGQPAETDTPTITSLSPRDEFALRALTMIMQSKGVPVNADSGNMVYYCKLAYKWAQVMMGVAASSRTNTDTSSGQQGGGSGVAVDVSNGSVSEKLLSNIVTAVNGLKEQVNTSLGKTLKIDNPANDKLEVDGAGGGASLNRDNVNDAAQAITDLIIYNTAAGKAPMRVTLSNAITKIVSSLSADNKTALIDALIAALTADEKTSLYNAIKDKVEAAANTAKAEAIAAAKDYTDTEILKKHPS